MAQSSPSGNPELRQTLNLTAVVLLVISSMIGSGIFKKIAPMSAGLGAPMLVLAAWGVAGLITLMGSLSNAEVGSMIHDAGGQYAYFKRMYGRFFAYLYGWTTFSVVQSATIASVGFVFAESLNGFLHLPELSNLLPESVRTWGIEGAFSPFASLTVKVITILLIWILVGINIRGVKWGSLLSNILATTILLCIAAILIMCMGWSGGSLDTLNHVPDGPAPYTLPGENGVAPGLFGAFFGAMLAAFWAYEGWNNIGYIGGEIKNPQRNIPLGLTIGTLVVTLIYVAVNAAYLYARPVEWLAATPDGTIAAVRLVGDFIGMGGAMFISLLILCSTFNATNSSVITAPRVYYAMAKDGLFFKGVEQVSERFQTPVRSLLLQGVWASVLVMTGSFDTLTDMLVFAAFIFYGAGAWGVIVLRRKMADTPRPFKVPGYPIVPAIFTLFSAALVINTLITQPVQAAEGLLLILLGLPFWFYWNRKGAAQPQE